jgi:hypothetical protein
MYASASPHSECQFPNSGVDLRVGPSLSNDTRKKLFWDNANRVFKQT